MNYKTLTVLTLLVSLTTLGGCASSSSVKTLQADVVKAQTTADDAASEAAAAKALAEQASADAKAAMIKADETDQKVDRMFEKAMHKQ